MCDKNFILVLVYELGYPREEGRSKSAFFAGVGMGW